MRLTALVLSSTLTGIALAQDLGVPLSWREFSNNRSLSDRQTIAQTGIDQMASDYNANTGQYNSIGFWPTGATVLSAQANYDFFTKTTTYKSHVTDALNTAFSVNAHYDPVRCSATTTTPCGGPPLPTTPTVPTATRIFSTTLLMSGPAFPRCEWTVRSSTQITSAEAASGTVPGKSFTIQGTCDGASMVGGVFWRPVADDTGVNSVTTGLSAYLAQQSGSATYQNAATAAGNWIKNANKNAAGLVLDTIHPNDCSRSPADWLFTYNSGKYVEGLVALYATTKDSSLMTEATNVAAAGMKNAPWQGSNGVITEGASPNSNGDGVYFKSVWVRALNELFRANNDQSGIAILAHSYIDVQYNAVLELAANGSTYSSSWPGPPQGFTGWGQAAALDVLVSAITANT
ncbi:endo-1,6-alpha-mannosidase [Daedaleopsis nitida]|nr:endo-1,6-alpha-mannosidase [Daedaleopsis nitida]